MAFEIKEFKNLGMNQDISISKAENSIAFENHNIRITTLKDSTLLSVTNERGPKKLKTLGIKKVENEDGTIEEVPYEAVFEGNYLGYCVLNKYLVVFAKGDLDYIYRFTLEEESLKGVTIFSGKLGFDENYKIETLPYYESEDIQKVYWVDGRNQPRFINITKTYDDNPYQFDFTPVISKFPKVSVTKEYNGSGMFPAGVVQYFISYYNKFGAETGIVWSSDLQYITSASIASAPDDTIACEFKLKISNIDTSYDYLRLYAVERTSLNATPLARIVKDIKIDNSEVINVLDNNSNSETIDSSILLFLSREKIKASTLTEKNDTLFLGNIELTDSVIPKGITDFIKEALNISSGIYNSPFIEFKYKSFEVDNNSKFQLKNSCEDIKTFKTGEIYRFAIQFQSKTGNWTLPIWVGDKKCELYPNVTRNILYVPTAQFTMSTELANLVKDYYTNYRLLIAETDFSTREILAQGIVSPTVFNHANRVNRSGPYSIASWIIRPRKGNAQYEHLAGLGTVVYTEDDKVKYNSSTCEIQNSLENIPVNGVSSSGNNRVFIYGYIVSIEITDENLLKFSIIRTQEDSYSNSVYLNSNDCVETSSYFEGYLNEDAESYNTYYYVILNLYNEFFQKNYEEIPSLSYDTYVSYIRDAKKGEYPEYSYVKNTDSQWCSGMFRTFTKVANSDTALGLYRHVRHQLFSDNSKPTSTLDTNFYVDSSIVNFYSPDIENNESLFDGVDCKFRIVGAVPIERALSDVILETNTPGISESAGLTKKNINSNNSDTLIVSPMYYDYGWSGAEIDKSIAATYYIYLWHKKGSIIGQTADALDSSGNPFDTIYADLKHKIIANQRLSNRSVYFDSKLAYKIRSTVFNSDAKDIKILKLADNSNVMYQGNYEYLAFKESSEDDENFYRVLYTPSTYRESGSHRPSRPGSSSSTQHTRPSNHSNLNQTDPVHIKYNTTPHLVFELQGTDNTRHILPYLPDNNESPWNLSSLYPHYDVPEEFNYPWLNPGEEYYQNTIPEVTIIQDSYLFLGEVYREIDYSTLYGGYTDEDLKRLSWIPASLSVPVTDNIIKSFGDTYYQKWDCLSAYPTTEEDLNSVVDITTFMVETRVNLESRYDSNKNTYNILNARRFNFNKFNPVYSQSNNFFKYNILDEKFNLGNFKNQVTWSATKNPTEDVDTWTKINLLSLLSLNGSYGSINKLENVSDTLVAFQDKAIATIQYNERTQLSTESGLPVEIQNSGKVTGYTYITTNNGCTNKWSIRNTQSGVYFIDSLNKSFFRFGKDGLVSISAKGMTSWFRNHILDDFNTYYDSITHDVYLINKDYCLVFNEDLQAFTSFIDYNGSNMILNLDGTSLILNTEESLNPYRMFEGSYGKGINNATMLYSMEYLINPEPLIEKTFTNLEFISDVLKADESVNDKNISTDEVPFDKFSVWNEYQYGDVSLDGNPLLHPMKKKFRVWRFQVPRDNNSTHKLDRIRSPWVHMKLENTRENNNKMVFHNMTVKYFK